MCGIAGAVERRQTWNVGAVVAATVTCLTHRGPDDRRCADLGPVALAQSRLSILDTYSVGDVEEVRPASPNQIVIARIHGLGPSLDDRIATLLRRGQEWNVTVNDTHKFRRVPGQASGPLLISHPSSVNYSLQTHFQQT